MKFIIETIKYNNVNYFVIINNIIYGNIKILFILYYYEFSYTQ